MRNTRRFASKLANLSVMSRLVMGLSLGLIPSCMMDDQTQAPTDDSAGEPDDMINSACTGADGARFRCFAKIKASSNTGNAKFFAAPMGFGAPDLVSAYNIDTNITTTPTIAIVDAYGYTALESDLGKYRTQYGLPACTIANGCLKIVNATGQTSPLPNNPPANDDWTVETALDVDMASAACPKCKILVVQATDPGDTLLSAQAVAKSLGATVISNSWGGPEQAGQPATASESSFNQTGVTIFVAAGDDGYNDAGQGPDYPGTSAYAIAVGGTNLKKDASARGWSETAWTMGGSACSLSIPKPAYQDQSPCTYKATTDVAAVGDPATGLAVYNAANGGWISVGGTSAASPLVAAIFAGTGNGGVMTGAFVKSNVAKFYDVPSGSNGTCNGKNLLCNAAVGWDGPTGYGTPNARMMMAATTTNPDPTNPGDPTTTPSDPGSPGSTGTPTGGTPPADIEGGCNAGGGSTGFGLAFALGMLMIRRRRQTR
jgi:hypothetical protein